LSKKQKKKLKKIKSQLCRVQALSKAGHCVAVVPSFAECQPRGTQQIIFQKKNFVEKSRQVTPPVSRLLAFAEC